MHFLVILFTGLVVDEAYLPQRYVISGQLFLRINRRKYIDIAISTNS